MTTSQAVTIIYWAFYIDEQVSQKNSCINFTLCSHLPSPPLLLQLAGKLGDGSIGGRQALEGAVGTQKRQGPKSIRGKAIIAKGKSTKQGSSLPKKKFEKFWFYCAKIFVELKYRYDLEVEEGRMCLRPSYCWFLCRAVCLLLLHPVTVTVPRHLLDTQSWTV